MLKGDRQDGARGLYNRAPFHSFAVSNDWDGMDMERIGMIGLGRMGSAMARRLSGQGVAVTGWTRSGRSVEGITTVPDIATLVAGSDTVILSLYDDAAVAEMLDALLQVDLQGRLIVETSTVVPSLLKSRQAAFAGKGADVADAPISGGPEMVEAGTCGFFVGADAAVADRATAILRTISPRVLHMGPVGAGMVMKTINNSMLQAYAAALREMLPLARGAGIPLADVLGVLNGGPAGIPLIRDRMPKIMGEDKSVGFTVAGTAKDNDVFRRVLEDYGLSGPGLEVAGASLRAAMEDGYADMDPAVAIAAAYHGA